MVVTLGEAFGASNPRSIERRVHNLRGSRLLRRISQGRANVELELELEAEVARWRRAQDIRDYVRAALAALDESDVATDDEQSARDRLRWALEYADRIDPWRG